ncbi:MAG: hypothetical protein ABFR63_09145 [Thermodesulfobacteriota bacterium]
MKRGIFLAVVTALLLLPISVLASDKSPWDVKLPFKSATIHYSISGMEKGSEVLYIRDYGRESATYHTTKTSMMGMSLVNETVEIVTPDWIYQFDLSENTGTKAVNPEKYMIEEYNKLSREEQKRVAENGKNMGVSVAEGLGGKVQQNVKKILGYSCDRAEMMGTVAHTIHGSGVPLLMETNMMGMKMTIEATSVDEGKVDDKFFQFPAGIEPVLDPQSDAMARELARQTVSTLKDPEGGGQNMKMPATQGQDPQMSPEDQKQMEQAMEMLKGMFGPQE